MNLQQLKYVRAAVQNDLNLTKVAQELYTSQSGVSKQIKELEAELKFEIFVRRGKRLVGLTKAGQSAAHVIDRLLQESDNLKRLSQQFAQADSGRLVIAATHNQANYVLPPVLVRFSEQFPDVDVELRQGSPSYVVDMLIRGEADIGIATEAVDGHAELQTIPCFHWKHVVIVPPGHELLHAHDLTLSQLARYPIITYSPDVTGGSGIVEAFERAELEPDIRLAAMDADVIKTYVQLGMGVGIIAQMAADNGPHNGLIPLPGSSHLFEPHSTKIALQRGTLLRNYTYRLIGMLAPHVDVAALSSGKAPSPSKASERILNFEERPDLRFGPRGEIDPAGGN
ncbi:MAG: LysR family transcriptional regulator [Sphingobium sp.]|nr:LysR family transcriptional regulator [Sphingobium sp.]